MHAVPLELRADGLAAVAFGPTPTRLAWTAPADAEGARMLVVAGLPATVRSAKAIKVAAISDVSVLEESASEGGDPYTGSIAAYLPAIAVPVAISGLPSLPDDAPDLPLPLPRERPRLAALHPSGDLGIKPEVEARAAIYDITARTVYLPNGEKLEAHSGLGNLMDDPRNVHQKNRGATPPNTYKLTMRESLFHGVRALRMTPVGEGKMYNRDGILAHSYLLGPSGQSNGCVSFKDYPKFLRAYLRGEVDRIVVVTRMEKPPAFYARVNSASTSRAF
jgi:hypothetical protein